MLRECRDLRRPRRTRESTHHSQKLQSRMEIRCCVFPDRPEHVIFLSDVPDLNSEALFQTPRDFPFRDFPIIQDDFEETPPKDSVSQSAELLGDIDPKSLLPPASGIQLGYDLVDKFNYSSDHEALPLSHFGLQRPDLVHAQVAASTTCLPAQTGGNSSSETTLTQKQTEIYASNPTIQQQKQVDGLKTLRLFNSSSTSLLGHDTLPQIPEELSVIEDQPSSNYDWPLPNAPIQHLEVPSFKSTLTVPEPITHVTSSIAPFAVTGGYPDFNHFSIEHAPSITEPTFTSSDLPLIQNAALEELGVESPLRAEGRSSRSSYLSITSLNRRLSFKYSQSSLEEINSLMERFTLSGSSISLISNSKSSWRSSKMSANSLLSQSGIPRSLSTMSQHPTIPVKPKASVILPGAFHLFCWDQIKYQNILGQCRDDGLLCQHDCPTRTFFLSKLLARTVIYRRIMSSDINEVDLFGNSVLHVAASIGAPVRYLIDLITKDVNVNATNLAGQTFLHLVHAPAEYNDICLLLGVLSVRGFNFGQHDHHGQTSLHLLTRPWLPQIYLITVIKKLHSLGFVLPTSRDSLGFTILNQMKYLGTHLLGFDPDEDMEFRRALGLTCETKGYIVHPQNQNPIMKSTLNGSQYLHNYEKNNFIETMEDLQRYEYHADLLRTILKAGDMPWFEDSRGRNGLHCLAEVDFDLPIPNHSPNQANSPEEKEENIRERYLETLLNAGVNPNNYDMEGNTPLMAFIIHARAGEDDDSTDRLLSKLFSSNADIHRRNRRGEVALHLAVKLGRRAATKFLLRHDANVHARSKKGLGILQIGWTASEKASQDENLYAQIMLCISLVISAGAKALPTILQEWAPR